MFITLEGGEAVGKSTLQKRLASFLGQRSIPVVETREPGGTKGAEAIRELVLSLTAAEDGWSPLAQTLLFCAARTDHLEKVIRPALARGDWVICDRFIDSTYAYQVAGGGLDVSIVSMLNDLTTGENRPDLTFVLDLDWDTASARMAGRRESQDAFEAMAPDFHARVREAFLTIARNNPERCCVLDAQLPPDALLEAALAEIWGRAGWT